MLTYSFDESSGTPLYAQLYGYIKHDISTGVLRAGEKLPSKRSLARHLQLAVITVQNAYAQLAVEGYIVSRERSGYFVARMDERLPAPPEKPSAPNAAEEEPERWLLDLRENRIDPRNFPFATWSKLMRQTLSQRSSHLLDRLPPNGLPQLRRAIAGHLYRFRGMSVDPENIVVAAGTELLYNLIVQLLGTDRPYALESPGYAKAGQICRAAGAGTVFIPLDAHGLDPVLLAESGAGIAHISPAHHFPTGIVMPIARRRELLRWAEEHDGIIIEDDYDSEFRFSGRPIETMQSIDAAGRVVYMNTFSKSIAPSIRISYMVLPPALMALYREKLGFYSCTVPSFEQYTLAQFIEGGYFEQHLSRMKNYYKTLRGQVVEAIDALPFRDRLTVSEEHAGLHFLLRVDTELTDSQLKLRAAEMGVRIACLSDFAMENEPRLAHTLVVNYSGVTPEQLKTFSEILRRI
ncbi:MAG: PLP-dependent aminotransferase family protein [Candidatus Heteroscillospira sp.]|jgi:GntR family transcriptional regulator/MocR family aminotransferase